ncbi:Tetratricopeptide repeat-containing protein [Verrucomicrobium sp. GAS474]|nr:Tetratricopeptide repeat-containing protein [Verrucomicrobium sp. GAS474]
MRFFRSLLLPLVLGLSSTLPLPARADDELPPEIAKLLHDAEGKRREAMNARFAPILSDLGQHGDGRSFYLQAVQQVQFDKTALAAKEAQDKEKAVAEGRADRAKDKEKASDGPQKAFSDWKIKYKDLLDDPRLGPAADIYVLYLRGQIQYAKGDAKAAAAVFDTLMDAVRSGPPTLTAYPLFKDSLTSSIFFKYYDLEEGYFNDKGGYYGSPADVEKLFTAMVEPWYEDESPAALAGEWDAAIAAIGQAAQADPKTADNFPVVDNPRLLVLKADSLMKVGKKTEAIETLKVVIQKFPAYPQYKEVTDKLVQWVTGKTAPAKS